MGTKKEKYFSLFWFCNMYMYFWKMLKFAFRHLVFGARGHRLLSDCANSRVSEKDKYVASSWIYFRKGDLLQVIALGNMGIISLK